MIPIPFLHRQPTPVQGHNHHPWNDRDLAAGYLYRDADSSGTDGTPAREPGRFLPWVCVAAALFAMVVFSVLREIQHNRELYQMSQKVTSAEAERKQCQEQLRMAEAREAKLQAELQGRPFLTRNPQVVPADEAQLN